MFVVMALVCLHMALRDAAVGAVGLLEELDLPAHVPQVAAGLGRSARGVGGGVGGEGARTLRHADWGTVLCCTHFGPNALWQTSAVPLRLSLAGRGLRDVSQRQRHLEEKQGCARFGPTRTPRIRATKNPESNSFGTSLHRGKIHHAKIRACLSEE